MKEQVLKIAGVKDEKSFYKKFPTQESFMKVHGKEFEKAQMGTSIQDRWQLKKLDDLTNFTNYNEAKDGIYIKPENRGKFNATKKATGKTTEELTHSKNPITRKRAIFAQNAAKWNKGKDGLDLYKAATGVPIDPNKWTLPDQTDYTPYINSGKDVIQGLSMLKDQKQSVDDAHKYSLLTGVMAEAGALREEPIRRRYNRPEDQLINPNQLSPSYGVGTNVLAKYGTEVPNDAMYSDLTYVPLNNPDVVKNYQAGGTLPNILNSGMFGDIMDDGGGELLGNISKSLSGKKGRMQTAGSKIGGGIGQAAGTLFGGPVGGFLGKAAGNLLGGWIDRSDNKIEAYEDVTEQNINNLLGSYVGRNIQNKNSAFMEKGGWVSNDWNPQVITKFGDYDVKDLFKPDPMMNTLRMGGHIRQNYSYPSDKLAMGGELQVYKGEAEPMSENPYLPDGGETVMFRGPSHADGGMPITYGQSPVEVEGGEPAVKLQNGGEENLVVFGNLKIPNQFLPEIGDPKAKGKRFKNYIADISRVEKRQNNIIDKSSEELDELNVLTPFDKLKFSGLEANILGGNMKLKDIADKKQKAALVQSAINDTAEEYGLVADDLAQGKYKKDKKTNIGKAQWGVETNNANNPSYDYSYNDKLRTIMGDDTYRKAPYLPGYGIESMIPEVVVSPERLNSIPIPKTTTNIPTPDNKKFPWTKEAMMVANEILPYLRPSNTSKLDPNQLMGEMYALSQNQLEPVQAQTYSPELSSPYDISLQDILNENQSDFNSIQRLAVNNPVALSALAAQKYGANQRVLGEQFRLNQAEKQRVYEGNRNVLNDAELKNLQILDQQYGRQAQAKTNTKAVTQAALSSISSKIAQNKLENRQLGVMENLYNYRYDNKGRAVNMNPLVDFDTMIENAAPADIQKMREMLETKTKKSEKKESRNGSIVRAIKNL